MNTRIPARRAAAVLAAVGALVLSSGIALVVTATPAHAGGLFATAHVEFMDPTCAAPASGTVTTSGDHVTFTKTPSKDTYSIGDTVTVVATAMEGYTLEKGTPTPWTHTFSATDQPCASVPPPVVTPPSVSPPSVSPPKAHKPKAKTPTVKTPTVTPTVVHAGLSSVSATGGADQGEALMLGGMLMLVAAGGLGLRRGGGSRS